MKYTVEQVQYQRRLFGLCKPFGYVLKSADTVIKTDGSYCFREDLDRLAAELNAAYLHGKLGDNNPVGDSLEASWHSILTPYGARNDPIITQAWLEGREARMGQIEKAGS